LCINAGEFIVLSDLTKVQIYFKHILNGFENGLKEKNLKKRKETPHPFLESGLEAWPPSPRSPVSPLRPERRPPSFSLGPDPILLPTVPAPFSQAQRALGPTASRTSSLLVSLTAPTHSLSR